MNADRRHASRRGPGWRAVRQWQRRRPPTPTRPPTSGRSGPRPRSRRRHPAWSSNRSRRSQWRISARPRPRRRDEHAHVSAEVSISYAQIGAPQFLNFFTSAPYQNWITCLSIPFSIRAFLALYEAGTSGIWSALPLVSQRLCRQRRRLATGSRRGDREAALSPTTPRPLNRAPDEIGPGPPMSAPSAATASHSARARERHEQILDRNRPGDEVLLDHVGDQRL